VRNNHLSGIPQVQLTSQNLSESCKCSTSVSPNVLKTTRRHINYPNIKKATYSSERSQAHEDVQRVPIRRAELGATTKQVLERVGGRQVGRGGEGWKERMTVSPK
jgi:hypothetical protein